MFNNLMSANFLGLPSWRSFEKGNTAPLYKGYVIGNQKYNNNLVYVFNKDLSDTISGIISEEREIIFIIYPFKINSMVETDTSRVLFGTDYGAYSDEDTISAILY
jgi:hypothetical protein